MFCEICAESQSKIILKAYGNYNQVVMKLYDCLVEYTEGKLQKNELFYCRDTTHEAM